MWRPFNFITYFDAMAMAEATKIAAAGAFIGAIEPMIIPLIMAEEGNLSGFLRKSLAIIISRALQAAIATTRDVGKVRKL